MIEYCAIIDLGMSLVPVAPIIGGVLGVVAAIIRLAAVLTDRRRDK